MQVSLSTTGFADAARCLKKYEYRWVEGLVLKPKDVRPAMRRGIWIHRALQLADQGEVWQLELQRMAQWAVEHDAPAEETQALFDECFELVTDYLAYWAGHEEAPGPWTTEGTEVPVSWEPRPGIVLTSTIDCIKRDKQGRLWIWERKTTQDIPDSDWRTVDPQTMLQYIEARNSGLSIAGIVFDYVNTRPGAKLRVTKNGGLYSGDEERSTRGRYWAPVEQELRHKGAAESYINEMRSRVVSDGAWFQRYYTLRPDDNARQTLHDVATILKHLASAQEKNYYARSISLLDCRMFCPYGKLCFREYQLGRTSIALREEYVTARTDDLYSEGRSDW